MADRRDRPPVLRVLFLLVALVSTALALAALSPARPDAAMPEFAPTVPGATGAVERGSAPTRLPGTDGSPG
ncbi:MAG TPA: hypothetical protein PKO45_10275 [Rubrivivax sp.]|nr:hypothetical protein [Burkholderiales bacterium]HNT39491.1 hypothetical protein [Rubrivivax sp.]